MTYTANPVLSQAGSTPVTIIALIWGVGGLGFAFAYSSSDWQALVGVLMANQAFCLGMSWHRLRKTATAILPDFVTYYLLIQFLTKSLAVLGEVAGALNMGGAYSLEPESIPLEYKYQAEVVFLLSTVLFTLTCRALEGDRPPALYKVPSARVLWWTFAVTGALFYLLNVIDATLLSAQLLRLFSIGALAALFGGRSDYALGGKKSWWTIFALLPWVIYGLRTGMKGEVVIALLPLLLPAIRALNWKRLAILGGFSIFLVIFIFPFSQAWRLANWSSEEQAGVATVASRVMDQWEVDGLLPVAAEGLAQWISRGSSSTAGGRVMEIAERDGLIGSETIKGLLFIFIPRIFWPEKPLYQPGAWFTWYLGLADSPESATSATAMLLPTELYFMYGSLGVFFGTILLAVLYSFVWRFLLRRSEHRLIFSVALFAQLSNSGILESVHLIYAITGPIVLIAYALAFDFLQRHFLSAPRVVPDRN